MIRLTSSNDSSVSLIPVTMSSEVDIPQHVIIVVIFICKSKTDKLFIAYFCFDNCLKNGDR